MNKSVLGFLAGVVIISIGVIGYFGMQKMNSAVETVKEVSTPARPAAPSNPSNPFNTRTATPPAQVVVTPTDATPAAPTEVSMTRSVGGDGVYAPGGIVDITVTLDGGGTEPIRALGISEELPDGFVFDTMLGDNRPDVGPPAGRTGTVEFAWITVPEFPVSFTYRLRAGDDAAGEKVLRGQALYRTSGGELRTGAIASTLRPGAATATAAPAAAQETAANAASNTAPANDAAPAANAAPEMAIRGVTRAMEAPAAGDAAAAPAAEAPAAPAPADAPAAAATASDSSNGVVELARTVSSATYTPGEALEVTLTLNYAGDPILALAALEEVPRGWIYDGFVTGEKPAVEPPKGPRDRLTFIWITVPTFPTTFTYRLIPAENESGPREINGYSVFRRTGPEVQWPPTVTQLNSL